MKKKEEKVEFFFSIHRCRRFFFVLQNFSKPSPLSSLLSSFHPRRKCARNSTFPEVAPRIGDSIVPCSTNFGGRGSLLLPGGGEEGAAAAVSSSSSPSEEKKGRETENREASGTAAQTEASTSCRTFSSLTTPPAPTLALPASNCGLTRMTRWARSSRREEMAGRICFFFFF